MPLESEEFGEEEPLEENQRQRHLEILKSQLDNSGSLAAVDWGELQNLLVGFGDSTIGSELLPVLQDTVSAEEKLAVITRVEEEVKLHYPGSSAGAVMEEWRQYLLTPQSPPTQSEGTGQDYGSAGDYGIAGAPGAEDAFERVDATGYPEGAESTSRQGAGEGSSEPEISFVIHSSVSGEGDPDDDDGL